MYKEQGGDTPVAWRTRWKNGSERDREWEMWTYRTEQPAPNDSQIIEALYATPQPAGDAQSPTAHIEVLKAALREIADKRKMDAVAATSMQAIARAALAPERDKQ